MTHYAIGQWLDYARGIASEGDKRAMEAHLSTACPECVQNAAFWKHLAKVCDRLAIQGAPEQAARLARAICPSRLPARPRRIFRIPVELVFDSFLAPAPVGLRATWQVGWQGLYRAGDCSIDVRIEPDLRSTRAALIGQISNHETPGIQMEGMKVSLKAGRQVIAETLSNRFGEFQIEYQQQQRLQLWIRRDDGSRIIAPLRRIAAGKPERNALPRGKAEKRNS
jgi:hypothetical protein